VSKTKTVKKESKPLDLSRIPAGDLYAELQQRKSRAQKLVSKYERLLAQTKELRAQIEAEGGFVPSEPLPGGAPGRVRPVNTMSLANTIQKVLAGKTLSVDEVTRKVVEEGYKSSSSKLRVMVNLTLVKDPRFKRVSRGVYTAAK
jgi:hypothetical protein